MLIFVKKQLTADRLLKSKALMWYLIACVIAGIIASLLNTFALYVDSKMFGYYSYAMVFGILWLRLGAGAISAVLMAVVTKPGVTALKKSNMI